MIPPLSQDQRTPARFYRAVRASSNITALRSLITSERRSRFAGMDVGDPSSSRGNLKNQCCECGPCDGSRAALGLGLGVHAMTHRSALHEDRLDRMVPILAGHLSRTVPAHTAP